MNRVLLALVMSGSMLTAGCSGYRESGGSADPATYLSEQSQSAIAAFKAADPTMAKFFDTAHAYAVFPEIAKGGFIAGAASGEGVVYRGGSVVGFAKMTQVTVGAQVGGQAYSQIVFMQDAATFERFTQNRTDFAATASGVIAKAGGAAANDYNQGVAVFVRPLGGAMAEAAIGGQKYTYRPK
jgi:lipid-binding SYLF domain-containing protein